MPYALAFGVLLASVGMQLQAPQLFSTLRNLVFDRYLTLRPRDYQPLPVRIVDIDEASLSRIGQWPWPRSQLAKLIDRLREAGAAVIALDIVLSGRDRSSPHHGLWPWRNDPQVQALLSRLPDHDALLTEAISRAPVVTGFVLTQASKGDGAPALKAGYGFVGPRPAAAFAEWTGSLRSLAPFEAAAAGNGALNFLPEDDGRLRKTWLFVPAADALYPGLAAEALRVAQQASTYGIKTPKREAGETIPPPLEVKIGMLRFPVGHDGTYRVHLSAPVPSRYLPAWQVLSNQVSEELIRGHIVFVGSSAPILKDLHTSPRGAIIPGVELHAQTVEQILQGIRLTRPEWALSAEVAAQLVIALVLATILARLGAFWAALTGGLSALGIFTASYFIFVEQGLLLDPLTPALTLLILYLFITAYRHIQAETQRRWIQKAFSSYVSPNLVQHLVDHPAQLRLGGEKRVCSFIFTDVAGFTSMVEGTDPQDLVALINEYLDGMTRTIFAHDGTIDRFVGDAVAVIFSAPVAQPDHAQQAVDCALALDRFAQQFVDTKRREGKRFGLTRIGVHTGPVIVGNFGGGAQLDYRAFGDAINTSARLESVNKHLGTRICVSGATAANCPEFHGRPIGTLVLKGKRQGVAAFEPLPKGERDSARIRAYRQAFQQLEAEQQEAFAAFQRLAAEYSDDPLAQLHWQRLQHGERGSTIVLAEK